MSLTSLDVAHIGEWTLYDDSFICAVGQLSKEKTMPMMGYAGATWEVARHSSGQQYRGGWTGSCSTSLTSLTSCFAA